MGIEYEDNVRQFALQLDRIAIEQRNPAHVKSRARDQAKRARSFDFHVQRAYRSRLPIRIILLVGEDKGAEQLGWDTSKVNYRSLDVEPWYVHEYADEDGHFRLVRGVPLQDSVADSHLRGSAQQVLYADQFSMPEPVGRTEVQVIVAPRSAEVRRKVLERAKGMCEYCGSAGFRMENGAVYLETHHVIPLAFGGPDVDWNVVAICPNDHRKAHFSTDREQMMASLVERLISEQPQARDALTTLVTRSVTQGVEF